MHIKSSFQSFIHLFLPNTCCACDKALFANEDVLCLACLYHLPLTDFHRDKRNESAQQLWGKLDFEFATSMLYLSKASHAERLLHKLKFNGFPEIGVYLGNMYGKQLIDLHQELPFDYIIPIPLHPSKLRKRGYNQSECFANGLSNGLKVRLLNNYLIRMINSDSQITKARVERYENVEMVFGLSKNVISLKDKHILLVDDVLTTGATLSVAGNILKDIGAKVSIVTLARA